MSGALRIFLQTSSPFHFGEHEIENDHIGAVGFDQLEALDTRFCNRRSKPIFFKIQFHQLSNLCLVFDDQNLLGCVGCHMVYRLSDSRFCENFKEPGNAEERITPQCYGCINEILRRLKKRVELERPRPEGVENIEEGVGGPGRGYTCRSLIKSA